MPKRKMPERVEKFYEIIREKERVFKSEFETIGLSSKAVDKYIEIIEYIRKQPEIKVEKTGRYTTYELEEGEEE